MKYSSEVIEYIKKNSDTPLKKQLKELKETFGLDVSFQALREIRYRNGVKRSCSYPTKYTPEVIEYLKENANTSAEKQLKELKEKFGLDITFQALMKSRNKNEIKRSYRSSTKYTPEVIDWMKENADLPIAEQVQCLKKQFGLDVSKESVTTVRMRKGIKSSVHFNSIFSKSAMDFMKENQYVYDNKTMTEVLNQTFGTSYTQKQINLFRRSNKITYRLFSPEILEYMKNHNKDDYDVVRSNINRIFNKNYSRQQIKSGSYWYKLKEFEKRRVVNPFRPDYSERKKNSERTRWEIKINGKWISKARYVYEQATGKKVGKDEVVVFLDGDINNFKLENLLCVKRKNICIVNRYLNGTCKNNGELTKCKYNIAELKLLIGEKQRKLKEKAVKK